MARRGLDRLWAPWRMAYIQSETDRPARGAAASRAGRARARRTDACLFCRVAANSDDRGDLVVARREHALLMLNRYPYNPGHVMVAVHRHAATFAALTDAERRDLLDLVALAEQALASAYQPHGVNYGANAGRVAGAGFPGHLHVHLVPRWNGDTNFMPVVGETRVLPESLDRTWARLRAALREARPARARRGVRTAARTRTRSSASRRTRGA